MLMFCNWYNFAKNFKKPCYGFELWNSRIDEYGQDNYF